MGLRAMGFGARGMEKGTTESQKKILRKTVGRSYPTVLSSARREQVS